MKGKVKIEYQYQNQLFDQRLLDHNYKSREFVNVVQSRGVNTEEIYTNGP